ALRNVDLVSLAVCGRGGGNGGEGILQIAEGVEPVGTVAAGEGGGVGVEDVGLLVLGVDGGGGGERGEGGADAQGAGEGWDVVCHDDPLGTMRGASSEGYRAW